VSTTCAVRWPEPLTAEILSQSLTEQGLANYFEIGDALAALLKGGNIAAVEGEGYALTENGRIIATRLESALPRFARERAARAASRLLRRARNGRENSVEIRRLEGGDHHIICRVGDGERELMEMTLRLPDRMQAELVRDTFLADPARVYGGILSLFMGEV